MARKKGKKLKAIKRTIITILVLLVIFIILSIITPSQAELEGNGISADGTIEGLELPSPVPGEQIITHRIYAKTLGKFISIDDVAF